MFHVNSSHTIDPTDGEGRVQPPYRWQMALVNEPGADTMPNALPFYDSYGMCSDRWGEPGVPYYAVRGIRTGEEVTVCYGPSYRRDYASVCDERELLGRWSRLQRALLQPFMPRAHGL